MGARNKDGTGLTSGDNIEHLWASIRPHSLQLKYMSAAAWQDLVLALVSCTDVAANYALKMQSGIYPLFEGQLGSEVL